MGAGVCTAHRQRQLRGAVVDVPIRIYNPGRGCSTEGCNKSHHAHGMCADCFRRSLRGNRALNQACAHCGALMEASARRRYCVNCSPPGDTAARVMLRNYNFSRAEYNALLAKQSGVCAMVLCGRPAKVIDHDHVCCPGKKTCGKCIRGLLCVTCNSWLAPLEAAGWLAAAQGYLQYPPFKRMKVGQ